ncbi:Hypothetical predicted protein [Pelobates cultripes]|uniref:Uncharacterized protein n=1 Tax=Pelobates cultripes TaxID=61616 RepID=A0AAD1RTV1_PELCU|nr:Hypothetical predicted protein [Pelobates cultripes]
MVDTTCTHSLGTDHLDISARLTLIFADFWQKLEQRMHQLDPLQASTYSPRVPCLPPHREPSAHAVEKAPKWHQRKIHPVPWRRSTQEMESLQTVPESYRMSVVFPFGLGVPKSILQDCVQPIQGVR